MRYSALSNPFRVQEQPARQPRVARLRRLPWATMFNAFGVAHSLGFARSTPAMGDECSMTIFHRSPLFFSTKLVRISSRHLL